jgi:hypothetical protein
MPRFRQDPTTKEWVIFATERAKLPALEALAQLLIEEEVVDRQDLSKLLAGTRSQ